MPAIYRKTIISILGIKIFREVEDKELYIKVGKRKSRRLFKNKDNKNKKA
ncbi:hypothetical protein R3O67_32020 [Bacillus cereus]